MKNTILFFAILVSISFFACSDYNSESSLITEPTLERPIVGTPNNNFPYPFLYTFEKIKDVTFSRIDSKGAVEIYIKDDPSKYSDFYVTLDYVVDIPKELIYVQNNGEGILVLENVRAEYITNINVYGAKNIDISREQVLPYSDGHRLAPLQIDGWKTEKENIHVYYKVMPYYVKFVFGELNTKLGDFLVFLAKPKGEEFVIPEFNKYGVFDLKLYGYVTPLERNFASE
ncbi:Hypothetical protein IALB_0897 [Ignavibacterium album JCM 16511]|uniref:Lipoprotein n=1 Tax=Ignavibacterium album (strain DSM 19864 / JCM 16511 / NBRC 101810 / Mat9-16) TaxID=945713 RepID=I0AI02_IGNAJ|nr:hypothetical protein [Ignavibacterium album]AFH48609.1 Hypothetical protein IALB_0897 [Ignavibacterium album JCM 16511]